MLKNFIISNKSSCIKETLGYRGYVYDMIANSTNEITFYNSDRYEKFRVSFQGYDKNYYSRNYYSLLILARNNEELEKSINFVLFEKALEFEDFYI